MKIFEDIDSLKAFREKISDNLKIGFVPTMGALHDGHMSLFRRAKRECDVVFASIFVNPTQFAPGEDLDKYPRNLEADCKLLESLGVEYLFFPSPENMYPIGYSTFVTNPSGSSQLCGESRSSHFQGVLTVVLKLFNLVQPNYSYFGKKDYQQLMLIERMVRDLNLSVKVVGCPIARESDGLAMSSRNVYLTSGQRKVAQELFAGLNHLKASFHSGEQNITKLKQCFINYLADYKDIEVEYIEIRNMNQFFDLTLNLANQACIALTAVKIGNVRLIDNLELN